MRQLNSGATELEVLSVDDLLGEAVRGLVEQLGGRHVLAHLHALAALGDGLVQNVAVLALLGRDLHHIHTGVRQHHTLKVQAA